MAAARARRAAIYARVSTLDQTTENQIIELRRYAETRGWTADEYVDEGVSGSTDQLSTSSSDTRSEGGSMFSSVGGSTAWEGISNT